MSPYILSPAEVRALIGANSTELKDETIGLTVWEEPIEQKIESLYANLPSLFETLKAKKEAHEADPSNPMLTRNEAKIYGSTMVYGTYAAALLQATAMPQFAYKQLGDGKAVYQKAAEFDTLVAALNGAMSALGERLLGYLAEYGEAIQVSQPVYYLSSTGLATDPVTGA